MYVLQAEGGDILIAGQESRNRAVDGDVVVVELLPKSQWKSKATHLVLNEQEKVMEAPSHVTSTLTAIYYIFVLSNVGVHASA